MVMGLAMGGEWLAGIGMGGGLAGEGLPAADGYVNVEGADFHGVAAAAGLFGGDEGCAAA